MRGEERGESEERRRALRAAKLQTPNPKHQTPNGTGVAKWDLEERLLEYAARIIRLVDSLYSTKAASHVGAQLLRSGTSPLANHGEAQAAESMDDFIHKLKICLKELQESWRWLRLIHSTPLLAKPDRAESLISETEELVRIFAKSIITAESRRDGRVDEPVALSSENTLIQPPLKFGVGRLAFEVKPPAGPVAYEPAPRKTRRSSLPRPTR